VIAMNVIAYFVIIAVIYSIASFASYSKEIRDSNYVFILNCLIGVMSSALWILMIRSLNDTNKIVAASLVWDLIVTIAYVVVPIIMQGKTLEWQAYAALALAVVAILWFKAATS
jgi:hypothetical protein